MNVVEKQVTLARRRINGQQFLSLLPWVLSIAWFVALLAVAVPKILPLPASSVITNSSVWVPSWLIGSTLVGLLVNLALAYSRRANEFQSAMEIDRRIGLRERTASAVSLADHDRSSAAGQVVIEDAQKHLDGLDLRGAFQLRLPRTAPLALLTLLAAGLVGWLAPNASHRAPELVDLTEVVNQEQLETTAEDLKEAIKEQLELAEANGLEEAAELFKALDKQASEFEGQSEMSKKEALVKLNDLKDQLETRARELGDAKEMREAFAKLDDIKQGPADKLVEAMQSGDFGKASEQLSKLSEQLGNEELSAEQKQELKQQVEQLAEKLNSMAQQQQQEKESLQQQIEEAQKLGNLDKAAELQEQLDQLQKQQGTSAQQLQDLAQQLQQAAQNLDQNSGDPNATQQAQQGLQDLAESLDGLQQEMEELQAIDGVLEQVGECKGKLAGQEGQQSGQQSGQGAQPGQSPAQGALAQGGQQGSDQPGQGLGEGQGVGARPESETEIGTFESKVAGKPQAGEVVISGKVGGPNQVGQSKAEIQQAIQSALSGNVDPVAEQQLPRSKRDHVKEYFEKLRKRGD